MVKRYKGIEDARAVFAKARRVLAEPEKTNTPKRKSTNPQTGEDENEATEADFSRKNEAETSSKRWMVTNRLDPIVGVSSM
jgi:hypothetical protein